jgi:hypothetical protein
MNTYKIAGITINIESDNSYMINRLEPFSYDADDNPDFFAETQRCNYIKEPTGELIVNDLIRWLRKNNGESGFHVYRKNEKSGKIMAHMETDQDWSHNIIKCMDFSLNSPYIYTKTNNWMENYSFLLMGILFRNRLLKHDGIVIHASSIAWRNKGLLFSAPSGTGKSTHVRIWEKYFGDEVTVVNDDTPAIRYIDGTPMLCGTPWSGSSDKFSNIQVPIKAIVLLEQAPTNSIQKLSPLEALPMIMPRVFLPYFDKDLMERAYDIIDKIITQIPIYILRCTPEKKAMELVYECVK